MDKTLKDICERLIKRLDLLGWDVLPKEDIITDEWVSETKVEEYNISWESLKYDIEEFFDGIELYVENIKGAI